MRHRWWIAALSTAALLGLTRPSQSLSFSRVLHLGSKKQEQIKLCIRQRAWMAYFRKSDGGMAPVRDTFDTKHDGDWIGLRFTEYDGPRIRLGVLKVINKSAESEERDDAAKIEVPVSGIQEILTVAFDNTRRFDVIEQKRIKEIKDQQTRTDIVEPSPGTIMQAGKVLAAQYLVYGTVNEYSPERASRSLLPGGRFNAGKKEAEVAITFALADAANGQILFTTSERARLGEWSFGFEAPKGVKGVMAQNTPVSYAVRACANKAAFKIATFLRNRKWKGSVVEIKKAGFYINAGSQQGMTPLTQLSVQSVEGIIKDLESRTILGEDLRGIGTLEVIVVQNGFSIARRTDGHEKIKTGDRVELVADPVPPKKIPECDNLDTSQDP